MVSLLPSDSVKCRSASDGMVEKALFLKFRLSECPAARLITQGGRCVGFAIDQHTNDDAASEIEWPGRKAWILSSPARLARLAKVPIVPIRIIWGRAACSTNQRPDPD